MNMKYLPKCIDSAQVASDDDDEDTRLIMEYHSWRFNSPYGMEHYPNDPHYRRGESSNSKPFTNVVLPPPPKAQCKPVNNTRKRGNISDYFGPAKKPQLEMIESNPTAPTLPEHYEAVTEIPGIPRRIDMATHVVFPYDGEIISRKTKKNMGFAQTNGYLQLQFPGQKVLFHRYMYEVCYNCKLEPYEFIDHLDHNKLNNRITNLRRTNGSGNNQNRPQPKRRRSQGLPRGVSRTASGRYTASITINGKYHYLGTFNTAKQASNAYKKAAIRANRTQGTNFYLGDQI
jgi:hypothetical protein